MLDRTLRPMTLALLTALCVSSCVPDADRAERLDGEYLRVVAAEDARPEAGDDLRTLVAATAHDLAFIRHAAVRALGRLERPELVDRIAPLLADPSPGVRRSAVNAVAQSFHWSDDGSEAAEILLERVDAERDPEVRGTIARSLGRLALPAPLHREVMRALVTMSVDGETDAPRETLVGVALGLESLVRSDAAQGVPAGVARRLGELAIYPTLVADDPLPGRIRALALNTLGLAGRIDANRILVALRDRDPQPRAVAARYIDGVAPMHRSEALRRVIGDDLLHTVVQGLLHLQDEPLTGDVCRYLFAGARPPPPRAPRALGPVVVAAVDALDRPCPDLETQRALLRHHATSLGDEGTRWQVASHALLSLASTSPDDAAPLLDAHTRHPNPFVRAYAARTAAALGDADVLRSLAGDDDPNVRAAAISGLFGLEGHDVDPLLLDELASDDPSLLMTVAGLLEDTPNPDRASRAALDAFERISVAERETWRDARMALLALVRSTGSPRLAPRLDPFLLDYDAVVAEEIAALLRDWTGRPRTASPRSLPRAPLPTVDELRAMDGAHILLHMERGGTIDIRLDPYLATTNAYRFLRLAREGYFDGLTFHRWAPNFVIQGGSPGANEYHGAAGFSRDEVGLRPHWRGTVGISTRGRDTGDAQIFVNLLDNVRLDHTYTVVGSVVEGMDVVDTVLEGDVIERVEIVTDS